MTKSTRKISRFDRAQSVDVFELKKELESVLDTSNVRDKYLLDSLLSKYADPSPEMETLRHRNAIAKFLWTDRANRTTSRRQVSNPEILPGLTAAAVKHAVADELKLILGDFTFDVFCNPTFSDGATASRARRESGSSWKMDGKGAITPRALPYYVALTETIPGFRDFHKEAFERFGNAPELTRGNVLFTVPKSDVINRVACKEPDLNMFLQKSVGLYIRKRLRRFGINLNDQSKNRYLARKGSITNDLATIDLSAASDSMTSTVLLELLPTQWFDVLDDIRSPFTYVDGKWMELYLFSTMGNGFTFELESALFFAMVRVALRVSKTVGEEHSVYGDDIIVPKAAVSPLIAILTYFGFKVNADKTFVDGPFRESCGGHYHNGWDITPIYIREPINSVQRVVWLLNRLRWWGSDSSKVVDSRLYQLWYKIFNQSKVNRKICYPSDMTSTLAIAHPRWVTGRLREKSRTKYNPPFSAYFYTLFITRSRVRGGHSLSYSRSRKPDGRISVRPESYKTMNTCYLMLSEGGVPSFPEEMAEPIQAAA